MNDFGPVQGAPVKKAAVPWVHLWWGFALLACGAAFLNPYLGYAAVSTLAVLLVFNLPWPIIFSIHKKGTAKMPNAVGSVSQIVRFLVWPLLLFTLLALAMLVAMGVYLQISGQWAFSIRYADAFYRLGNVTLAVYILCISLSQISYMVFMYKRFWKEKW